MTDKPWTYSHTQLSMYRRCPRLYHDAYVLGLKQPTTPNMAFGTLVHTAIETFLNVQRGVGGYGFVDFDASWDLWWANFLADCGETDSYDDPIFNLKTAKRCLDLYRKHPIEGDIKGVEKPDVYTFPTGHRYSSRPDFVVEDNGWSTTMSDPLDPYRIDWRFRQRKTVDLKLANKWYVKPLSPFDDQLLGQAIVHGADAFIRYTFPYDKKTGKVDGPPIVEEQAVDPVLRDEWLKETLQTIVAIDAMRNSNYGYVWPKNDDSCYDFNRECHRLKACRNGATSMPLVKDI